jgi:segregation and condensation protein B
MSKKSRKKQKPEETPGVPPVGEAPHQAEDHEIPDHGIVAEETSAPGDSSAESAPEAAEAAGPAGEETGVDDLPEGVAPGTLSGEPASGEAPPLTLILEAILFASQKAVPSRELVTHLRNAAAAVPPETSSPALAYARVKEAQVNEALVELQAQVAASGRAYQVRETATGWLLSSAPGYAPWLRALYPEAKPTRLSASALETLAIIAYRQPITRADMEAVRGVSVDGVMQTLLDRGLVKIAGRSESAGRPLLYATTQFFLDHFGLRHLDELPNAAELRHIPLPKAESEESIAAPASDQGTPELPGVLPEGPAEEAAEGAAGTALETVEVTQIIEVRESVVFEEVADGASPSGQEELPGEEPEVSPDHP